MSHHVHKVFIILFFSFKFRIFYSDTKQLHYGVRISDSPSINEAFVAKNCQHTLARENKIKII